MTEKVGLIKNPLTIIAIFAGIAEVSGTIVLPFIAPENQIVFIYFLMVFPSILVILFFLTLNFNNKVLYAPSDYKDEQNYITVNRFDISKQKTVEVTVPKEILLREDLTKIQTEFHSLKEGIELLKSTKHVEHFELQAPTNTSDFDEDIDNSEYKYLVSNLRRSRAYIKAMHRYKLKFEIYYNPASLEDKAIYDDAECKAIWLGKSISLIMAKNAIITAKDIFPQLSYILISGDKQSITGHEDIYIGGDTEAAINKFGLKAMQGSDFRKLFDAKTIEEFHSIISMFY